jgi:proteasome component ECM29
MAIGNLDFSEKVFKFFCSNHIIQSTNIELHFTAGESLAAICFGFESETMKKHVDYGFSNLKPAQVKNEFCRSVLDQVFALASPSQSPSTRKSASVWLLSLLKLGSGTQIVKSYTLRFQSAFAVLLKDGDEFIQELSSKAIGLLFDGGDESVKDSLVSSLVADLTSTRRNLAQSVSSDTPLFGEGSLGQTPDGEKITTYQNVLSLAADMNQPDLVYRFMSLAAHSAFWNSKKGASLGFKSVAARSKAHLKPHLPKLIPKLYRYQFDPNPKISENMKNIWESVVDNPTTTIKAYWSEIMTEVLAQVTSRTWRTREACCRAMGELVYGRTYEELHPYLEDLWGKCFRCMDDVKESVRLAALFTCKSLTSCTMRFIDQGSKDSSHLMQIVIPLFLKQGMTSMSEEVKTFSLSTLFKICDHGGKLLRPHITEIAGVLLENLSALEPQVMSN